MTKKENNQDHPIIVIGTGSVGVRFIHQLLQRKADIPIKIFGAEADKPYSREDLSIMLAGKISEDELHASSALPNTDNLQVFLNNPIDKIDHENAEVIDSKGNKHPYKTVVLAVGSKARKLDIEGGKLKNVFTFRTIQDAELLRNRQITSRRTLIVGGGLIGLDVANAMMRHKTEVTVIENSTRLMNHQLDDHASVYLRLYLDDLGMDVRKQTQVVRIEGENKVKKVVLDDGEIIPCDTVIISIGIDPNIELAKATGLLINKGIMVNNQLQTSNKTIYAIGECAEYKNRVFGVVKPGYEQAEALAEILTNGKGQYKGSTATTRFKVVGYPILSIGDNGDGVNSNEEIMYRDIKHMVYRKLVLNHGCLCGVVAAGDWKKSSQLHDMVEKKQHIWPWQRAHFRNTGEL